MGYDAFISYKSEDRPWAEALRTRLGARQRQVFVDYANLRAGGPWQPQLEKALADSRALVVLWSTVAAQQSALTWTEEERYLFTLNEIRTPRDRRRPVIFVLLDAAPTTLGALHHVTDIKDGALYPLGAPAVPNKVWDDVVTKICDGIDEGLGVVRVRTLVLSAALADFNASDLGSERWTELTNLLVAERIVQDAAGVHAELKRRYYTDARAWRPFATDTISQLLEALRLRLESGPNSVKLRFESVDADFASTNAAELSIAAQRLSRQLGLIVVDPLALYRGAVAKRVGSLEPCFRSPMNAVVFPALKISDDTQLNQLLQVTAAAGLLSSFFRPAVPAAPDLPSVGIHVRNQEEIGRILLLALGRNSGPLTSLTSINPVLSPG